MARKLHIACVFGLAGIGYAWLAHILATILVALAGP